MKERELLEECRAIISEQALVIFESNTDDMGNWSSDPIDLPMQTAYARMAFCVQFIDAVLAEPVAEHDDKFSKSKFISALGGQNAALKTRIDQFQFCIDQVASTASTSASCAPTKRLGQRWLCRASRRRNEPAPKPNQGGFDYPPVT